MNRRNFIRNASLATAGGLVTGGLPAWASAVSAVNRRVVLAVVAGISREDFIPLFPKTFPNGLGNAGRLITDMRYNGQAAGHRLALECLLQGRYLPEKESGKTQLLQTALFNAPQSGNSRYLISSEREFLKTVSVDPSPDASHFCIGITHPADGSSPRMTVKNANLALRAHEKEIALRLSDYPYDTGAMEDLRLAEAACVLIQEEKPQVLVTHFMGADAAHSDTAKAKKNREYISVGLQRMWDTLLLQPEMKNTLFVVVSDFGRNTTPNGIQNAAGRFGTDHSVANETTRHTACLLASPKGLSKKTAPSGETVDILPTLLHFLGTKIPEGVAGKSLL